MYLITGKPNTGKSTAIRKIIHMLGKDRCGGFFTEEIIENGERTGFITRTISGKERILAHKKLVSDFMVEDFGVDLKGFEELCLEEISRAVSDDKIKFIIIDEIGPMQLHSTKYRKMLEELLKSNKKIIATVCIWHTEWLDSFRNDKNNTLYEITEDNRDELPLNIIEEVNKDDELFLSKIELAKKYCKEPERYNYEENEVIMRSTHDVRRITRTNGTYHCSCDYCKQTGTCSHIMSLILKDGF